VQQGVVVTLNYARLGGQRELFRDRDVEGETQIKQELVADKLQNTREDKLQNTRDK